MAIRFMHHDCADPEELAIALFDLVQTGKEAWETTCTPLKRDSVLDGELLTPDGKEITFLHPPTVHRTPQRQRDNCMRVLRAHPIDSLIKTFLRWISARYAELDEYAVAVPTPLPEKGDEETSATTAKENFTQAGSPKCEAVHNSFSPLRVPLRDASVDNVVGTAPLVPTSGQELPSGPERLDGHNALLDLMADVLEKYDWPSSDKTEDAFGPDSDSEESSDDHDSEDDHDTHSGSNSDRAASRSSSQPAGAKSCQADLGVKSTSTSASRKRSKADSGSLSGYGSGAESELERDTPPPVKRSRPL